MKRCSRHDYTKLTSVVKVQVLGGGGQLQRKDLSSVKGAINNNAKSTSKPNRLEHINKIYKSNV